MMNGRITALLWLALPTVLAACGGREAGPETEAATFEQDFGVGFRSAMGGPGTVAVTRDGNPAEQSLRYDRSLRLGQRIETVFADNLGQNFAFPLELDNPRAFVTEGHARALYSRELAARGLPADSAAGATTLLFGVAWEIANDRRLSQQENAAILRQAENRIRRDSSQSHDETSHQTEAEAKLLTAAIWLQEVTLRRSDSDKARALSDAVRRDMQAKAGSDMRDQRVTRDGFVAK